MDSLKNHLSTQDTNQASYAVSTGADLGAKAGCLLSALYIALVLVVFRVPNWAGAFIMASLSFYMVILVPVLLLGAITGAVFGWLSRRLSGVISKQNFVQIGVLVCIIILVVLHIAFFISFPLMVGEVSGYKGEAIREFFTEPFEPSIPIGAYWFFIGFPSIIYIVSGGWVSQKLWMKT